MTKEQILKIIVPEGAIPLQTEIDKVEDILELISQEKEKMIEEIKNYYDEVKSIEIGTGEDKTKELMTISYCIGLLLNLLQNK